MLWIKGTVKSQVTGWRLGNDKMKGCGSSQDGTEVKFRVFIMWMVYVMQSKFPRSNFALESVNRLISRFILSLCDEFFQVVLCTSAECCATDIKL